METTILGYPRIGPYHPTGTGAPPMRTRHTFGPVSR